MVYFAAIAFTALLSSCNKNPPAPNNSVNPVDATNIDSLVSSVPEFQPAPTWPTRVDCTTTDTTSTVDTSDTQVDSTTWLVQNVSYSASAGPSTYIRCTGFCKSGSPNRTGPSESVQKIS